MHIVNTVTVLSTKWNGDFHRRMRALELGSDEWGTWLWTRAQTEVETASGGFRGGPGMRLFPRQGMWSAYFVTDAPEFGRRGQIYVDITTEATREGDLIEFVDLDLDVEQFNGDEVKVLDRDEFEENAARWNYPADLIAAAEEACKWVTAAVSDRKPPFDETLEYWWNTAVGVAE